MYMGDHFLLDAEGIEESMDISTLDGFLTAIACEPQDHHAERMDTLGVGHRERRRRPGIQGSGYSAP